MLELVHLEQKDATWKSYSYNLPRGTLKFLLNSVIDTLPTKVNLKLWGKRTHDKCHCGERQTLNHILNCCKQSLEDGRYTYRHDNVLRYIFECLDSEKFTVMCDLEGAKSAAGGTLTPDIVVTTLKPDLVVIDKITKALHIFELTVPNESRIEIASKLKMDKYQHFKTDCNTI